MSLVSSMRPVWSWLAVQSTLWLCEVTIIADGLRVSFCLSFGLVARQLVHKLEAHKAVSWQLYSEASSDLYHLLCFNFFLFCEPNFYLCTFSSSESALKLKILWLKKQFQFLVCPKLKKKKIYFCSTKHVLLPIQLLGCLSVFTIHTIECNFIWD